MLYFYANSSLKVQTLNTLSRLSMKSVTVGKKIDKLFTTRFENRVTFVCKINECNFPLRAPCGLVFKAHFLHGSRTQTDI